MITIKDSKTTKNTVGPNRLQLGKAYRGLCGGDRNSTMNYSFCVYASGRIIGFTNTEIPTVCNAEVNNWAGYVFEEIDVTIETSQKKD